MVLTYNTVNIAAHRLHNRSDLSHYKQTVAKTINWQYCIYCTSNLKNLSSEFGIIYINNFTLVTKPSNRVYAPLAHLLLAFRAQIMYNLQNPRRINA